VINYLFARVRNSGQVDADQVEVVFSICFPRGGGDVGNDYTPRRFFPLYLEGTRPTNRNIVMSNCPFVRDLALTPPWLLILPIGGYRPEATASQH
jgi:hypothetical protein